MKILFLSDEESKAYWDFFKKEDFADIDLIVSCGDLKAEYLSFLTTMTTIPVLYVHGNHDDCYEKHPPEGCICIEDSIYVHEGVRILGLGGSYRYKEGKNQYTDGEMRIRAYKMMGKIFFKGGFDILVTHAPAYGINDENTRSHRGFQTFIDLIHRYQPKYFVHGHIHMNYGRNIPREYEIEGTKVINAYNHYILEI